MVQSMPLSKFKRSCLLGKDYMGKLIPKVEEAIKLLMLNIGWLVWMLGDMTEDIGCLGCVIDPIL